MSESPTILDTKPQARILDATAANRMIWRTKKSNKIIWIDIEPELEISPDLIIDCAETGFPDYSVMTIFFDPPHWWGDKPASTFFTCRNKKEKGKFVEKYGSAGVGYYGTDKYQTKSQLLSFLHRAQKEFYRILYPDGMLWLNWSEVKLSINKILPFFKNWDEMIRLEIGSKYQQLGEKQNYWILLMKKDRPSSQVDLTAFMTDSAQEDRE